MLPRHGNIWTVWGAEIFWWGELHRSNETNLRNPRYPPTNSKLQLKETRSLIFGVWLSYISSQCNVVHKSRMIVRTKYNQGICPAALLYFSIIRRWHPVFWVNPNNPVLLTKLEKAAFSSFLMKDPKTKGQREESNNCPMGRSFPAKWKRRSTAGKVLEKYTVQYE